MQISEQTDCLIYNVVVISVCLKVRLVIHCSCFAQ